MKEEGSSFTSVFILLLLLFLTLCIKVHAYPQNPFFFLQKKSTRLHTKRSEVSKDKSKLYNNGVRSWLACLENTSFFSIFDLLSSHKV